MLFLFKIINYSTFIIPILTLIGFVIGMCFYKKIDTDLRILVFLFLYAFMNEVLSYLSAIYLGSNLFFLSTYSLAELVFLSLFLKKQNIKSEKIMEILFLLLILFNFYEIFNVNFMNFNIFQSYSRSLNSIFLLSAGLLIIISKLKKEHFDDSNILLIAIACFATINALIYLPINLLVNYDDISVFVVWFINTINIIVFFSIIIHQLWKFGKTPKI